MAATYGYGKKTFVPALAIAAHHMAVYIVKHDKQLKARLSTGVYDCVVGLVPCLNLVAAYRNESAG